MREAVEPHCKRWATACLLCAHLLSVAEAKEFKIGVLLPGRDLYNHPRGTHEIHAVTDLTYRSLATGEPRIMDSMDHDRLADANVTIKVVVDSGVSSTSAMNKTDYELYDMEIAWSRAASMMPKVDALLVADWSDAGEVMLRAANRYGLPNMAVSTSMTFADRDFFPYTCRAVQSMKAYQTGFAKFFGHMNWRRFATVGLGVAWQVEQMRKDVGFLMEALLLELPSMEYPLERYALMAKWPKVDAEALSFLQSSIQEVQTRLHRIIFVPCANALCASELGRAMSESGMDRAPYLSLWQSALPKTKWDGMFSFEAEQSRVPDASNFKQVRLESAFRDYGPGSALPYFLDETWDIWNHGWTIKRKEAVNHSTTPLTNPMTYLVHDSIWAMALGFAELEKARAKGLWHPGSDVEANDANGVSALTWAIKNVSFQGASGPIHFDRNCEAVGNMLLMNTVGTRLKQVGKLSAVGNLLDIAKPCDSELHAAMAHLHETNYSAADKACLVFPENFSSTHLPADRPPACPAGSVQNGSFADQMNICQECPAGFYAPAMRPGSYDTLRECLPCPYGYYQDQPGQGQCKMCTAGSAQNETGQVFCSSCARGKYTPSAGNSECFECPMGRSTDSLQEQSDCTSCPHGRYADAFGLESCKACPLSMTTSEKGASNASACGCAAGQYEVGEDLKSAADETQNQCYECPEGVKCLGFDSLPLVEEGYYMDPKVSRKAPVLQVWKCTSAKSCPGQSGNATDAVCTKNMDGLNCGLCQEGYYRSGQHECEECGEKEWIAPLVFLAFFLACGLFHYIWHRHASHVEATENLLGSITLGVTLSFFQSLGVFDRLNFSWPALFQRFLDVIKILFFDLSFLGPDCVLTQGLAMSYSMPMSLPLVIVGTFLAWYGLSIILNFLSRCKFPRFGFSGIINSTGMIIQALYISICATTVSILDCYESDKTVGTRVIRSRPYAICWSTDHNSMIPLIVLGLTFYVVGILATFIWAVAVAPRHYVDDNFRTKINFMVFKYRPNTWWYGIILMIRALALSMVSVIFPDDAFQQFLLMLTIFVAALCVHLTLMPLADGLSNNMEAFEICLLIAVLGFGSYFMTDRDFEGKDKETAMTVGTIMMLCVAACGVVVSCVFLWSIFLAHFPHVKRRIHRQRVEDVLPKLHIVCSILLETPREQLEDLMHNATYIDRWHIFEMVNFLLLETRGVLPQSWWERRLPVVTRKLEKTITRDTIRKSLEDNFAVVHSISKTFHMNSKSSNDLFSNTSNGSLPCSLLRSRSAISIGKSDLHTATKPDDLVSSEFQMTCDAGIDSQKGEDANSEAEHKSDDWDIEAACPMQSKQPRASIMKSLICTGQPATQLDTETAL